MCVCDAFYRFLAIFVDFRVPLGTPLASKSLPGEGESADRIRLRFQGGSRTSFLIDLGGILRSFWERFSCYVRVKFAVFICIWVWECYGKAMEILREWERNIIRILLEYYGNTLEIFWE